MTLAGAGLRPFNRSGFEILDDGIGRGEVVIWSVDPVCPRQGDVYLIESDGRRHAVIAHGVISLSPKDALCERLAAVGGTCKIHSVAGRGTRVELTVFLKSAASPVVAIGAEESVN